MVSRIESQGEIGTQTDPLRFRDLWRIEGCANLENGLEVIHANNRNWTEVNRWGHAGGFDLSVDHELTHGRMMLSSVVEGRSTHDTLYKLSLFERLMSGEKEVPETNVEPINTLQYWMAEAERFGQSSAWAHELHRAMKIGKIAEKIVLFDRAMDVIDAYIENDPCEFMVRLKTGLSLRDRVAPLSRIYGDRDPKGRERPGLIFKDRYGNYGSIPNGCKPRGLYIEVR
ncbi:hypothetical protein HZB74_00635 [Candidatus Saccharibacteria bacterium]|nr:hypothetical protein [Candidatus Saccharibacteria bacterium]